MGTPIKIGINGFGRIGRKVFRLALSNDNVEVAGINDLGSLDTLAHLLQYDSVHGKLDAEIRTDGNSLLVNGKKTRVTTEKDPAQIPWKDSGAQVIHECTGIFTAREKAALHLQSGSAKKVVISAPGKEVDLTVCIGVNENVYDPSKHHVISNASCTTNCLAPLAKVIDQKFGIECGTMTTVHSYTNDQKILDLPHKDIRRARAAALSMIPTSTGAAKAVGLVLPHLQGKLDGLAIRVPTPNVSLVDLTCTVKTPTHAKDVNAALQSAADGELKGILGYSEDPLVSCDYNGNLNSSTVDAEYTKVMDGNLVKVISWYDNESGFSNRLIDLTLWLAQKGL